MLPDARIPNPLSLKIEEKKLQLKKPMVINVGKTKKNVPTDLIVSRILFNSYFFLSDELKLLFNLYDDTLKMIPMLMINNNLRLPYWMLEMEATANVVVNKFLKIHDMVINEELVKNKPIHKIHYDKQTYILVNLYVVESILRRYPSGVFFQAVRTVQGG